jgi:hypothetical protein
MNTRKEVTNPNSSFQNQAKLQDDCDNQPNRNITTGTKTGFKSSLTVPRDDVAELYRRFLKVIIDSQHFTKLPVLFRSILTS